jgi:hypothetical protein
MSKSATILAAALAAVAGSAVASADDRYESRERHELASDRGRCTVRPSTGWLSMDQVIQMLKEKGFTVRKVEASHGCYEVKATNANGVRLEFYVDPATAEMAGREGGS